MELDALRRQWQHQPAAAPSETELRQLLTGRRGGPVAYLRRQVLTEAVAAALSALGCAAALLYFRVPPLAALLTALALLSLVTGAYYAGKLWVLRRLGEHTEALHQHVRQQLRSLRQLIRLGYWASMAFAAVWVGLLGYWVQRLHLDAPLWLGLTAAASLLITHYLVRYHLRTTYGPPLDQLARYVQELEAPG